MAENELIATTSATLAAETEDLAVKMVAETDPDALKKYYDLFNILQSKKDILRNLKLNDLLDKVQEQAAERFENCPYDITNKEVLDYMQVVQNQIQQNNKNMREAKDAPMIQLNKQEINVTVGDETISRSMRDNVLRAIQQIIAETAETPDVIDLDLAKEGDNKNDD